MSTESARVQRYFERHAKQFDRIYRDDTPLVQRMIDRWRRRSMFDRFRLALEACGEVEGLRVLDVGCGSGRYGVALAQRGAQVVGVDFSAPMVRLASEAAASAGVASRCRFLVGDILRLSLDGSFDLALAIGVFDYTRDPAPILAVLRRLTRRRIIASFPARHHPLYYLRRVRLGLARCPVYGYTASQIRRLFDWPGAAVTLYPLGRDYVAVVELE